MSKLFSTVLAGSLKSSSVRSLSLMAAAGLAAVVAAPRQAEAASFTYNFLFSNSLPVSLTLSATADPLVSGSVYDISSLSGTIGGVAITGLDPYQGASQKFKFETDWIYSDSDGISFVDSSGAKWNMYNQIAGFEKVSNYVTDGPFYPASGSIVVPGTPAPPTPPTAPGPLPIFGASVAFGMSRQLRRRVKAAS
jgi:hypothetical protein